MGVANTLEFGIMEVVRICDLQTKGSAGHDEIKVQCPFSSKHTIYVNNAKGTFKCWHDCSGCPGPRQGGTLDLYRLCKGCKSRGDAAKEIKEILFGGAKKGTSEYREIQKKLVQDKEEVKVSNTAPDHVIDHVYRKMLAELPLKKEHVMNLRKRGLSNEEIQIGMYRSIPSSDAEIQKLLTSMQGMDLKGIPGFYPDKRNPSVKRMQLPGYYDSEKRIWYAGSGYFVPSFNAAGQIFALQIRMDDEYLSHFDEKEAKKRRYLWFSSSCRENGAAAKNRASFGVVDGTPRNCSGYPVYITEGALKANVAHCLNNQKRQFASIAGISNVKAFRDFILFMKRIGCPVIEAFDMDRYSNDSVANAIARLHKIAAEEGWPMRAIKWNKNYKGIDDYLFACKKGRC